MTDYVHEHSICEVVCACAKVVSLLTLLAIWSVPCQTNRRLNNHRVPSRQKRYVLASTTGFKAWIQGA